MSEDQTLVLSSREKLGSAESRRLRRAGQTTGNIYGNKKDTLSVITPSDAFNAVVRTGKRVFTATLDGGEDMVIFKELQFDAFGYEILHFDLQRVDPDSRIDVEVLTDLRGTPEGVTAGGILDHQLHTVLLNCLAVEVPDKIVVRIGALELGDAIHASDLKLPEGVRLATPEDAIVVQVVAPTEEEEEEADELSPLEPEVIGKDKEDEEE